MIELDVKTIVATNMESTGEKVSNGIIIPAEGFTSRGIHPRWCKVYKVGSEVTDVKEGDWIYVEHGRWSYAVDIIDDETQEKINVWVIDPPAIMLVSDCPPDELN